MQQNATPTIPAGFPRAATPRSVAILGWAKLSMQAREGSGYNLSASELAAGLVLAGHRVSYLASGMYYSVIPGLRRRESETWRGVRCSELVNSPNLSPAAENFYNRTAELSCAKQNAAVLAWLDDVRADVVHIHSLEGFSLDLIPAVRASGRPVVVTPHNYWYVCPQVDLLHEEVRVCTDYRGGERCIGCLKRPGPRAITWRRKLRQSMDRTIGPFWYELVKQSLLSAKRVLRGGGARSAADQWEIDPELGRGFQVAHAPDHAGTVQHVLPTEPPQAMATLGVSTLTQNEEFLAGGVSGGGGREAVHLRVLNDFGRRRVAGIEALRAASLVTPPSAFVARVHESMGLEPAKQRTVRLGQPHFDLIHRRAKRSPYYNVRPWDPRTARRPLRLAFLGTTRHNKGLAVLIDAILSLEKDVRQRCQFLIRASGWDWPFRRRVAHLPEVQFAGGYDLMQLVGAGGEYDVGILPHIWFENSPLVMLEHLHAGKFMIASRLGGPPEWILPPKNGLLFPGGDSAALASCIARIASGEVVLPSPREIHEVTPNLQSYPGHVAEVMGIYEELLDPAAARSDARLPDAADAWVV